MIKFHKPLIIAEIGLSHNGNMKKALDLIYLSKESGADIVKFQSHFAIYESTFDEPFRVKISTSIKIDMIIGKKLNSQKNSGKK